MIALSLAEIAAITGGRLAGGADPAAAVASVCIDSRRAVPGALFFALRGEHSDGHAYAGQAIEVGAVAAVISRQVGVPAVVVTDPFAALQQLARRVRERLTARVVAVTGSTGKTTTKDLVAGVISRRFRTVAAEGSFNNELGVPLTVLSAGADTQALVLEMGSRGPGQLAELCGLARPEIGVVTNVGPAHVGLFGSVRAIGEAKAELVEALAASGTAILNADDEMVAEMAGRTRAAVLLFGCRAEAAVRARDVRLDAKGCPVFTLIAPNGEAEVALAVPGEHQVSNSLAAAAVGFALGLTVDEIALGLAAAKGSPMRMEVLQRPDGIRIVNDAYNANPDSMAAALRALAALRGEGRAWAVLGEMAELGSATRNAHEKLGKLVAGLGIDRLVGVGRNAHLTVGAARRRGMPNDRAVALDTAEEAVAFLAKRLAPQDTVLVKASRVARFERIVDGLLAGTLTEAVR
ncbi:MAG: UDP-N-acetylmuramoyl-tripeptide--D-alanyl-D-alanine ligase [Actinomycetota bacterium]